MPKKTKKIEWVKEIKWEEFRNSGLLLFVNSFLHIFGRAIVFDFKKDKKGNQKLKRVYFARCKYRGFDLGSISSSHTALVNFLEKNIKELKKDCSL